MRQFLCVDNEAERVSLLRCPWSYSSPSSFFFSWCNTVLNSFLFFLKKKSSEMCYFASGSNQSLHTSTASCRKRVNRGKMIFRFCCSYYLVSRSNLNSVMSPITSGMHHVPLSPPPPPDGPWGGSPWHCGAPTALIRVHVSWWHQPAALTYAFIFTILHHNTVITTVREHGSRLERLERVVHTASSGAFFFLSCL